MEREILEDVGLERKEVTVYLSLLKIGLSTTGAIVDQSGVPSSHVYSVLNKLVENGLVSYSIIKNTKYFKAEDPQRLYDFIDAQHKMLSEKKAKLSIIIPELQQKQLLAEQFEKKKYTFLMYEGLRGIKTALENVLSVLKKGDEFIVFGAPRVGNVKLHGYFNEFHQRRAKKGISYKVIYNSDAREFGEERKTYTLTQVRYLEEGMVTPSVLWIFKDHVAHVVFTEEPVAFIIHNKQIAESSLSYFKFMWKRCKK